MAKDLFSTRRMEALTDGVFAIAMTLLVLDISVDKLGNVSSNQQLINAFTSDFGSSFISFIISFLLLGSMWAVHARQFDSIKFADRRLMMINNFRLLAVVLIPFTTSLSGTFPELTLATMLFPLNFMALTFLSSWEWSYATSNSKLYDKNELSGKTINFLKVKNKIFALSSVIVTVLSFFIGSWAFILFLPVSYIWMKLAKRI